MRYFGAGDKGGTVTRWLKTHSREGLGRAFRTEGLRPLRGGVTGVLGKK